MTQIDSQSTSLTLPSVGEVADGFAQQAHVYCSERVSISSETVQMAVVNFDEMERIAQQMIIDLVWRTLCEVQKGKIHNCHLQFVSPETNGIDRWISRVLHRRPNVLDEAHVLTSYVQTGCYRSLSVTFKVPASIGPQVQLHFIRAGYDVTPAIDGDLTYEIKIF